MSTKFGLLKFDIWGRDIYRDLPELSKVSGYPALVLTALPIPPPTLGAGAPRPKAAQTALAVYTCRAYQCVPRVFHNTARATSTAKL